MTIAAGIYKKYQTTDEYGLYDLLETCENLAEYWARDSSPPFSEDTTIYVFEDNSIIAHCNTTNKIKVL